MSARSAFARMVDEELKSREEQEAGCAYVPISGLEERWGVTSAQALLEAAEAVRRGEIVVTAVEVQRGPC